MSLSAVPTPNVTLEDIANRLTELSVQKEALIREEKLLKSEVANRYAEKATALYALKDAPFGAVNIEDGDYVVSITTPKKIKWDQTKLAALWVTISETDNPLDYIAVEYYVPESKYKSWPEVIKDEFADARTIEPGTPVITIKRKGE